MKKIITASEASQLSSHNRERLVEIELERIMDKIAYQTSDGKTRLKLDGMYKENADKLKELGYKVNLVGDFGEHCTYSYYSILWGDEKVKEKKKWWWQR